MWRNADVLNFVGWARAFNEALPLGSSRICFYGLDLYSLHASIRAVIEYLERVDPAAAGRARHRYRCFDIFGGDPQAYGYAASLGISQSCKDQVIQQLLDLHRNSLVYARRDGVEAEEFFSAEQNAQVVRNAEVYYRTMFRGDVLSWNLRDAHMADTFERLLSHLVRRLGAAKIVVWAHNSHIGDARATQMGAAGEWNLGQLMRQKHGRECYLIGFTTFSGTVTAASEWGSPAEIKQVRRARPDSFEALFHQVALPAFFLPLSSGAVNHVLEIPAEERAIGVIYRPETEMTSHYFPARLSRQFDAVIHIDCTRAVEPLEPIALARDSEPAETYPTGV